MLLGDLKGTTSYFGYDSDVWNSTLVDKIESLHSCFCRTFLEFLPISRSMVGYTFSDSVLVRWNDYTEGKRVAIAFATRFWEQIEETDLQMRVYVDEGIPVPERSSLGPAIESATGRLHQVFPVSTAVWSVFLAENSHFPNGIFIGSKLATEIKSFSYNTVDNSFKAGPFEFFRLP